LHFGLDPKSEAATSSSDLFSGESER